MSGVMHGCLWGVGWTANIDELTSDKRVGHFSVLSCNTAKTKSPARSTYK